MNDFTLMYDSISEEYVVVGPDGFSANFFGPNRGYNALLVLKTLTELTDELQ